MPSRFKKARFLEAQILVLLLMPSASSDIKKFFLGKLSKTRTVFSMKRSEFLKNSFATGLILSLPNGTNQLLANSPEETEFRKTDPIGFARSKGYNEPLDQILIAGTIAPNSHNSQPWKVKKDSNLQFSLFGDFSRQLLPIDPKNRQFFHSQGCFLEMADQAAKDLGYKTKITLFPSGVPDEKTGLKKPVATFAIVKDPKITADPLFDYTKHRQMNRAEYQGNWITEAEGEAIAKLASVQNGRLIFVTDLEKIQAVSPVLVEAFATEIRNKERNEINRQYFRISNKEIYEKADGLTLEGAGLSNPLRWFAKKFFLDLSYDGFHSEASIQQSIEVLEKGVRTAKGYVFLVTEGKDDEKEWVQAGSAFVRTCLALAGSGISFHTINQAFVDYPESLPYQQRIKSILGLGKNQVIQLGGRIGRSDYRFASPRRDLDAFLVS